MKRFVTALIDTYNHERYIEQAIVSVLEQDFPASDMEVVVVDDGSTDRTPEIVRKFSPRVRLLQKKNGGQASAFNVGFAESQGQMICLLDGDDAWLPAKVQLMAKHLAGDVRPAMLYHDFRFWDGCETYASDPKFTPICGDILPDRRKLITFWGAPTSSLAFPRESLQQLMPIPDVLTFMADTYLVGTVITLGPVLAVREYLTNNRIHGHNLWFAKEHQLDPAFLRRRMKARQAAIDSVRQWVQSNCSLRVQFKMGLMLKSWDLVQDRDEFQIHRPGRFRYSAHLLRQTLMYRPLMTRQHFFYSCALALASLVLGHKHLHYMEGIRTRLKKLRAYILKTPRTADRKSQSI